MTCVKKIMKYTRNHTNIDIFNFTLNFLVILHPASFCDPIVCYLEFLAAVFNTQIVQCLWFFPLRSIARD